MPTDTEREGAANIAEAEREGARTGEVNTGTGRERTDGQDDRREGRKGRRGSRAAGALNVTTTAVEELVKPAEGAYMEDPYHRPDPLYQYGTVDTTEGGGGMHGEIHNVTPAFAEARARNLVTAARALDPLDTAVPRELVTLPEGTVSVTGTAKTAEEGREEIEMALNALAEDPHVLGASSPAQRAAAEEWDDGLDGSGIDKDNDGKPDMLERDGGSGSERTTGDSDRRTGETNVPGDRDNDGTPDVVEGKGSAAARAASRRSASQKS